MFQPRQVVSLETKRDGRVANEGGRGRGCKGLGGWDFGGLLVTVRRIWRLGCGRGRGVGEEEVGMVRKFGDVLYRYDRSWVESSRDSKEASSQEISRGNARPEDIISGRVEANRKRAQGMRSMQASISSSDVT